MNIKAWVLLVLLLTAPSALFAKKQQAPVCTNNSTCVDEKNFYIGVKKISIRGSVLIVQVEYVSKIKGLFIRFNSIESLDSNGNELKIDGKNMSDFSINKGERKIVSFRFRGEKDSSFKEPFDLFIKANSPHGEITLFNLKSKNIK